LLVSVFLMDNASPSVIGCLTKTCRVYLKLHQNPSAHAPLVLVCFFGTPYSSWLDNQWPPARS
jgi:hypothetical protein